MGFLEYAEFRSSETDVLMFFDELLLINPECTVESAHGILNDNSSDTEKTLDDELSEYESNPVDFGEEMTSYELTPEQFNDGAAGIFDATKYDKVYTLKVPSHRDNSDDVVTVLASEEKDSKFPCRACKTRSINREDKKCPRCNAKIVWID